MSRVPGTFKSAANYELQIRKPFDARQLVPSYADLLDTNNWITAAGTSIVFNGLVVAVANTQDTSLNGLYRFFDPAYSVLAGGDVTNPDHWVKLADNDEIDKLEDRMSAIEDIDLLILDGGSAENTL